MSKRPRVLLIAEAANPEWVSVPLVGWSLSQALREVAEVHLVTQIRNRDAILRAGLVEGRDVTFIDSEAIARPAWKLAQLLRLGDNAGWTIVTAITSLTYGYFEDLVWRRFGDDLAQGRFDLVHRIVPLSLTANSKIAPRCAAIGVPFIVGPLNGGVAWPAGFRAEQRREREYLADLRSLYKLRPGRGRMLQAASAILCGSHSTLAEIPARFADKTRWLPENAIDPTRFSRVAAPPAEGPLRACFIGRLVPYKGAELALEAAAPLLAEGRMTYEIVGDGPEMPRLKAQIARLGVPGVTFHGWRPHAEVQDIAAGCHILLFPSVREFGGGAVLEAMALGVVPVVVDYAGPGELVAHGSDGLKVPIGDKDAVVAALAAELRAAADDPARLVPLAAAAREKVMRDYTWSAKARQIASIYDAVLSGAPLPRPLPQGD